MSNEKTVSLSSGDGILAPARRWILGGLGIAFTVTFFGWINHCLPPNKPPKDESVPTTLVTNPTANDEKTNADTAHPRTAKKNFD